MHNDDAVFVLPNKNLRVVKSLILAEGFGDKISTFFVDLALIKQLSTDEFDIFLILQHFYIKSSKVDGLISFTTDDILFCRGLRKIRHLKGKDSGYKKIARTKVLKGLNSLFKSGLFIVCEYKDFCFAGYINRELIDCHSSYTIPRLLVQYHTIKYSWHKSIGYFLVQARHKKSSDFFIIQIKKLLSSLRRNYSFLAPNEIRTRFENTMDGLAQDGIISEWYYKSIDENSFQPKGWLYLWERLSVVVSFKNLPCEHSFLNF